MEPNILIISMIACLVGFLCIMIFRKSIGMFLKLILNGVLGFVLINAVNTMFAPLFVGVNVITLLISAALGVPGVVALYIASMLF